MKTKKLNSVMIFLAGVASGGILLAILSFTSPPPPIDAITVAQAKTYFTNYYGTSKPLNDTLKGFRIARSQYDAMTQIIAGNKSVTGFSLYFAKDSNALPRIILVGIKSDNKDDTQGIILMTDGAGVGPCPTNCDSPSPIIKSE